MTIGRLDDAPDRFAIPFVRFAERCASLGLSCARLDPLGVPIAADDGAGGEGAGAPSPGAVAAARSLVAQEGRRLADRWPAVAHGGDWVIAGGVRRGVGLGAVVAITAPGRLCSGQIEADRLAQILRMCWEDVSSGAQGERAVEEFSDKLAQAYDELAVLYDLGRSMRGVRHPEQFLRRTLDELRRTLGFAWTAIRFLNTAIVPPQMAGSLTVAGRHDCDTGAIEDAAARAMADASQSNWLILSPADGEWYQQGLGRQVLARPIFRVGRVVGVVLAGGKGGHDPDVSSFDTQLIGAAADFLEVFVENSGLYSDQKALFMGTLVALTSAIDAKDSYTRGHSERVALLGRQLSLTAGLGADDAERIHLAGTLHDVGKIGVPESVLCKAGRLTKEEFNIIKQHPEIGHRILRGIPGLLDVLPGVLYHHERWDGGGYPHGLTADETPYIARILAVADAFDAMSSTRSYRPAMPRDRAIEEIRRCTGTQFDPQLAESFLTMDLAPYDEMMERHRREAQEHLGGGQQAA